MHTHSSSRLAWKTAIFLVVAVIGNSFGTLTLAVGMNHMPPFAFKVLGSYAVSLATNPYILIGTLLTAIYTLAQLSLFSWADLSYVIPCTASTYLISTVLGHFVMREGVSVRRWLGVLLITFGVVLVANTPIATKPHEGQGPPC